MCHVNIWWIFWNHECRQQKWFPNEIILVCRTFQAPCINIYVAHVTIKRDKYVLSKKKNYGKRPIWISKPNNLDWHTFCKRKIANNKNYRNSKNKIGCKRTSGFFLKYLKNVIDIKYIMKRRVINFNLKPLSFQVININVHSQIFYFLKKNSLKSPSKKDC